MLKFITKTNYEQQKAFLKFQLFRKNKFYLNFLTIILGLIFLVVTLLMDEYVVSIAIGILILINIIMYGYIVRKIYRINLYEKDFSQVNQLLIEVDYQTMDITNQDTNEKVSIPLDSLESICELKNYIFFYITKQQAICLDKEHLVEGDFDQFIDNLDPDVKKSKYRKYF